ncbi:MAG: biosynthetic peptidoglycan transglycosylase [Bacteroidota bacterium]|nr:biosynthetic peptidoglycan transglycosylase [Bacteroidota bacterium]
MDWAIGKASAKLKNEYAINLSISQRDVSGLNSVNLGNVKLVSHNKVLFQANNLNVSVMFWPLFSGKVKINSLECNKAYLDANELRKVKSSKSKPLEENKSDTSIFGKLKSLAKFAIKTSESIPDNIIINSFKINYNDSLNKYLVTLQNLNYVSNDISSTILINRNDFVQNWKIKGVFNHSTKEADVNISTDKLQNLNPGNISRLENTLCGFKQVNLKLESITSTDKSINIRAGVIADSFYVHDARLSPDSIIVTHGGISFNMDIDSQKIILKDPSRVILGKLSAELKSELKYSNPKEVGFNVTLPTVNAQDVIDAMPIGTFDQTRGLKIEGTFSYKLDFFLDITKKDSIVIKSDLDGNSLKINQYGLADLSKMNSTFTYQPFNSNRTLQIGPASTGYVSLGNISKYLPKAIMSMEDPHFYSHNGFEEASFARAFLENLKKGAFKKSGSTITQQLVKNVFLTHKKTIDRKIEEMLITWLIENLDIVSKNKMLEVYMNLIEWGPEKYGIKEAAAYYFNKSPADLKLSESIFLAHIIRSPKKFMYFFNNQGTLNTMAERLEHRTAYHMYRLRMITDDEYSNFWGDINLTGPASSRIKIVPIDTSEIILEINPEQEDW